MRQRSSGSEDPFVKALDLLSRRDHSSAELAAKLKSRGFQNIAIKDVLDRLVLQHLLDDRRFALRFAESALASGRAVGSRLRFELQQKGISRELAEEVIAAATAETAPEDSLALLVSRRFPDYDDKNATQNERQRVYNFLMRRGFQLSTIIGYFRNKDTE